MCSFPQSNLTSYSAVLVQDHWWLLQVGNAQIYSDIFQRPYKHDSLNPRKTCYREHVWWRQEVTSHFSWLARFTVQCIMQQATWLNTMRSEQMTFGVIWEVGHKFSREQCSAKTVGWQTVAFFCCSLGSCRDAATLSQPQRNTTGWRRSHVCSASLCQPPQTLPHTNFAIITRILHLDAILI